MAFSADRKTKYLVYICLLTFPNVTYVSSQCVDSCVCDEYNWLKTLICTSRNLTKFPKGIDEATQFIIFNENKIKEIPGNLSEMLPGLEKIDLRDNDVQELRKEAFRNLKKLSSVALLNNKLSRIEQHIFRGVESLEMRFNVNGNKISYIHPDAFAGFYGDMFLDIGNNLLDSLHEDTFKHLTNLYSLVLKENKLKKLPKRLFDGNMNKLFFIDLYKNQLEKLEEELFQRLTSLVSLDLASNKLKELPDKLLQNNHKLKNIKLDNNLFSTPPTGLPKKVKVYLKGNPIVCDCNLKKLLNDTELKSQLIDIDHVICDNFLKSTVKEILAPMDCTPTTTTTTTTTINTTMRINTTQSTASNSTRYQNDRTTTTDIVVTSKQGGAISKQSTAIVIIAILVVFVLAVVIALLVYLHRKSIASYIVNAVPNRRNRQSSYDSSVDDIVYHKAEDWYSSKTAMVAETEADI